MKKLLLFAFCFSVSCVIFGQPNNPHNNIGEQYNQSLKILSDDFKAGKVKEINEESLNHYSSLLPIRTEVNIEMATNIYNTLKNPDLNYVNVINSTNFSGLTKEVMIESISMSRNIDYSQYRNNIFNMVERINQSEISNLDKEFTLSMLAIAYNLYDETSYASRQSSCGASGPGGSGDINCFWFGAGLGGVLGGAICGVPCGIGGAVIGGVIGAMSN